ncbi:MAG TPA: hypothetical protein VGR84_18745 [Candidatus Acidoferrales bacterium]|nr:hypothetical protein [Candidatus Acidoferrales bacterium]
MLYAKPISALSNGGGVAELHRNRDEYQARLDAVLEGLSRDTRKKVKRYTKRIARFDAALAAIDPQPAN